MTKKHIIKNSIKLIEMFAKELNLNVNNKGEGHAFDNSFWKDIFVDDSKIPEITARNSDDTFSIGLRSYWGNPEIDIRYKTNNGEDLYVFNFSDGGYDENGNYFRSENFKLYGVSVDVRNGHKEKLDMLFDMINFIETSKGYGVRKIRKLVNNI